MRYRLALGVSEVYPRVGGGNIGLTRICTRSLGLSPRGRGKLSVIAFIGVQVRSIPAWAGETYASAAPMRASGVYPRVGGGNRLVCIPTGRGSGLSPRGRGKLRQKAEPIRHKGSIPAWAGETYPTSAKGSYLQVYPRVGGGNPPHSSASHSSSGLSPRGRGKQRPADSSAPGARSIPAWAGETTAHTER